jgi:HAD superfamily hydrolase (TIGR01484 family)
MKEIEAVIFDIDGTAITNQRHSEPTDAVIDAVKKARDHGLKLSFATGRNFAISKRIAEKLSIVDPCVISAGAQIIEPATGKEVWSVPLSIESCKFALSLLAPHRFKVILEGESYETARTADQIVPAEYRMLDVQHVPKATLPDLLEALSADSDIMSIPVHSSDPDLFFLHVTNKQATKQHAVEELIKILGVSKGSVAGVGDGLNDLELFKSVGHKIAMGNAVEGLKNAADRVIPSVDDDGLAKYLLEVIDCE